MAETICETTEVCEPVQLKLVAGEGAEVLAAVDRRGEEGVRGDVVVHHEVVLRVRRKERVVVIALVGLRTGALSAQDVGNASQHRDRGRRAGVSQEAPPGHLALCKDLVMVFCCHGVPISLDLEIDPRLRSDWTGQEACPTWKPNSNTCVIGKGNETTPREWENLQLDRAPGRRRLPLLLNDDHSAGSEGVSLYAPERHRRVLEGEGLVVDMQLARCG